MRTIVVVPDVYMACVRRRRTWLPLKRQYAADPVASATAFGPPSASSRLWHSLVVLLSAHMGQSRLAKHPERACIFVWEWGGSC